MHYSTLACDYDGTLAHDGRIDDETIRALERLKRSGRTLLLVTGRVHAELLACCPCLDLFDLLVLENGAVLVHPATGAVRQLTKPPPVAFVETLRSRGVGPIGLGHVIVATWEPHQSVVLDVIREMELELQVIFNKGAVMILPSSVNKAFGLSAALDELHIEPSAVVGVGDAENDHAFLAMCGCGVAVRNALESVKKQADWIAPADHGRGVQLLVDKMLDGDLPIRRAQRDDGAGGVAAAEGAV